MSDAFWGWLTMAEEGLAEAQSALDACAQAQDNGESGVALIAEANQAMADVAIAVEALGL